MPGTPGDPDEHGLRDAVSSLVHEVRNPLATIKSGLQLVQHLTRPQGEIAEYFDGMLAEVARIDRTARSLQRLASLAPCPGASATVAEAAAEVSAQSRAASEASEVTVQVDPGRDCRVGMDPGHLRLALGEIVANAIRCSPPGGRVAVSWAAAGDRLVRLRVDDQGPGVPAENAEMILRPFFTTTAAGVGLGLNIAARACLLAGGRLEWQNLPGGGCRFTLVVPEA